MPLMQKLRCLLGLHVKKVACPPDANDLNYIECRYCGKYLGELPDEYHAAERVSESNGPTEKV